MKTIRLRQLWTPAHFSWKWVGDTIEDDDLLRRLPGAKVCFTDSEYPAVLEAVSIYGYCLSYPPIRL